MNESFTPSWYTFRKNDDHVLFCKLEENKMSVLEVTDCIRIDSELHVQPFFKGAPVLLTQWIRQDELPRDGRLSRKSMLKMFLLIYSHGRNCIPLSLKKNTNTDFFKK